MSSRQMLLCAVAGVMTLFALALSSCAPENAADKSKYTHAIFDRSGDHTEQVQRGEADSSVTHIDEIRDVQRFVSYGAGSFTAVRIVDGQPNVYKLLSLDPCGQVYIVTDVAATDPIWAQQRYTSVPNSRTDVAVTMIHVHNLDEVYNPNIAAAPSPSAYTPSY